MFGLENVRHSVRRHLIGKVRMIQYHAVAVNQKRVTFARVTFRQNLYQSVKIKIYGKHADKLSVATVNHFGHRNAIIARPVVKIRRRNGETVGHVNVLFGLNVPRTIFDAPIRVTRLPAVVHDNLMLLVRIRHVTRRNIGIIFRYAVQKFHRRLIVVQNFRLLNYRVGEHSEDTPLLDNPVR